MSAVVTLEATAGELKGKKFEYKENCPRLYLGRNEDCAIVLPEKTVSRYHCVLEVQPPKVRLQDFGSLNGTFLNHELIGKRDPGMSPEEARDMEHGIYTLKDGDILSLGKSTAFAVRIFSPLICARCGDEFPSGIREADCHRNKEGEPICETCYEQMKLEIRRKKEEKRCSRCGKKYFPTGENNNLCPDCLAERGRIIDDALEALRVKLPQITPVSRKPSILPGYEVVGQLGKGAMGEVQRIREVASGREYALKTMQSRTSVSEKGKKLFLREANVCKYLQHKNVVRSYEVGCEQDTLYILMEICEGGSVYNLMQQNGGRLSQELSTYIILQTLSGLDYVHNAMIQVHIHDAYGGYDLDCKGVVHRDLKPDNIFLSDTGAYPRALIADFGLAKAMDTAGLSDISKTGTDLSGTCGYMSRVQAINCKHAKGDVDVWSAAASYYHMLTGELPKDFSCGKQPLSVVVGEYARPIRDLNPDIPRAMAEVIDHALRERPQIGFQTAEEFRTELVKSLSDQIKEYCLGIIYE